MWRQIPPRGQRSTASASPQKQDACPIRNAGKRDGNTWRKGPTGSAVGPWRAVWAEAQMAPRGRDPTAGACPQKRVTPGLRNAGTRNGATWHAAPRNGADENFRGELDFATWQNPTIEARPRYRAAPEINKAGKRECAEVVSSGPDCTECGQVAKINGIGIPAKSRCTEDK